MSDQQPGGDPKAVWQNQPVETSTMTWKLIRSRARELRSRTRRKLIGTVAGPLTAAVLYVFGARTFSSLGGVLHPLFAAALVWSLIGLYFLNRGMWSAILPADAGLRTGLQFCLGEVQRQRDLLRRVLLWSLGPVLLAVATLVLGLALSGTGDRGLIPNGLPFLVLLLIWICAYFVIRARELRQLRQEIDELKDLQSDNPR